jgi:NADH-quinone oxidoreductase subunit F
VGLENLRARATREYAGLTEGPAPVIYVGSATCGQAAGASELLEAIPAQLQKLGIEARVVTVGCIGACCLEPLVDIQRPGGPRVSYSGVTPSRLRALLRDCLLRNKPHPELAVGTIGAGAVPGIPSFYDHPMLRGQVRIVLKNCGIIDPASIEQYLAVDGFSALEKALALSPVEVIEEVKRSGLRGRGGAGFSTGLKWELCRAAPGAEKYLVCNADEGDPGAFMDRSLLESDPFSVLEGMVIAAYAIGASRGYVYIRAEYPLAIRMLRNAISRMEEHGLLGDRVLGSDFQFHLGIKEGAGAFVCGEETALIASLEGRRGMPRQRPPYPAREGFHGLPTNINNVETFANVPHILREGADWFARFGTETSRGTKTFALTGKVKHTGLIEVPMGIRLKDVVYGIGGGILDDRPFKAAQTGGPSGGCIPSELLDTPIDYESLAQIGSIMGSGGLVVMDDDNCMVDVARYFLAFTQSESCGKCIPCRLGTRQMLTILDDVTSGRGKPGDIELLHEIGEIVRKTSLCGLGQSAPNPVLTTIRYFRAEYEEHIREARCRAAVCQGIVPARCRHTCPAGVDVPRYVRLIRQGDFESARKVIQERLPFAWVCGLVCYHPCELKCRRGMVDQPVSIRALKRAALEYGGGVGESPLPKKAETGKRVAIIGSGPAGLTAAYYLRKLCRHTVHVFEALSKPGGTLRYGIPEYRLPEEVLDQEIKRILSLGVKIKTRRGITDLLKLKDEYDAVLVAVGAQQAVPLSIPGERQEGVLSCQELLKDVKTGRLVKLGPVVAVIGGGNSAVDAARTARRIGAREVIVLYRRTDKEMPAYRPEVEAARAEGIEFRFLVAPVKADKCGSRIRLTLIRMALGDVDRQGRRRPVPVPGSEYEQEFDQVVSAIGLRPATHRFSLEIAPGGEVRTHPETLETSHPGIFAGGDAVLGAASVIDAVAHGRRAAIAIDRHLGGRGEIEETLVPEEVGRIRIPIREGSAEMRRAEIPSAPVMLRIRGFGPAELGYSREQAILEATRCLQCDLEQ